MQAEANTKERKRFYTFPSGFKGSTSLWRYQAQGVLHFLSNAHSGNLDDPGTGKTIQTLYAFCDMLKSGASDALIVVLKSSYARTWMKQVKEHAPHLRVQCLAGEPPNNREWIFDADVYLMSYSLLSRSMKSNQIVEDSDAWQMWEFMLKRKCYLVCDESHTFSSPSAQVTRVLMKVKQAAARTGILTGSLISDRSPGVYPQMKFIDPHDAYFPESYEEFKNRYAKSQMRQYNGAWVEKITGGKNLPELHDRIARLCIRRTSTKQVIVPMDVHCKGSERVAMKAVCNTLLVGLKNLANAKKLHKMFQDSNVSRALQDVQKAAASCTGAKMDLLKDRMDDIGSPVVVWCFHREVCESIAGMLKDSKYIHGGIVGVKRNDILDDFDAGRVRALVCTMDSMRESHTLTTSWHAFYFQLSWKLLNWVQTLKRIDRISQRKGVVIDVPLLDCSIDAYMYGNVIQKAIDAEQAQDGTDPKLGNAIGLGLIQHLKGVLK